MEWKKYNQTIKFKLQAGSVWVEGDNKDYSIDSTVFGPISVESIVGIVPSFCENRIFIELSNQVEILLLIATVILLFGGMLMAKP